MNLGFIGCLLGDLRKNPFRDPLCALPLKRPLATKAMAFDAPKAVRHELVSLSIMLLRGFVLPKIRKLDREP